MFRTTGVLPEQDYPESLDATYECVHGRLPQDTTPACGCWAVETGELYVIAPGTPDVAGPRRGA